jgi:very-short-patch-repair endonuclease
LSISNIPTSIGRRDPSLKGEKTPAHDLDIDIDGQTHTPHREFELAALAKRQHGVVSRSQLICSLLGFEVDALWPRQRLVAELDGFAYHRHRAAFERDRARDAALQASGYRVIRFTYRRIVDEPDTVAEQLRALLGAKIK